jgi:hypothetical protein
MGIRESAITIAKKEVGVQEVPLGSNWGPRVSEYIKAAGYDRGVFWCLCFLYWCVQKAAEETGSKNPLPRTGSCDLLLTWARRGNHLCKDPQPGDFFFVMATENDAIHVGMVLENNGETIKTIEGNSNSDGSNNGFKVAIRPKRRVAKLQFVRWAAAEDEYTLIIGTTKVSKMPVVDGVSYAPVRPVVKALGLNQAKVAWDPETPGVRYDGNLFHAAPQLRDGVAYIPVRAMAGFFGLELEVDDTKRTVKMVRP